MPTHRNRFANTSTRRGRQFMPLADKAVIYNLIADEGVRKWGAKYFLYAAKYAESQRFFDEHPELREVASDEEVH